MSEVRGAATFRTSADAYDRHIGRYGPELAAALIAVELTRWHYVERSPDPAAYCEFFRETFRLVAGLYAALADRRDALAALDRDFLEFAARSTQGPPRGPAEYHYEYLPVVGRKPE